MEAPGVRVEVELEPGRSRIAVAGLSDRAGGQEPSGFGARNLRPAGRELPEVEPAESAEVVVADEADPRPLAGQVDDLVRTRPVADEVAEAPDLVRRLAGDRFEDNLERM